MTARRIGYRANRAMSMENTANERESGQTVPFKEMKLHGFKYPNADTLPMSFSRKRVEVKRNIDDHSHS